MQPGDRALAYIRVSVVGNRAKQGTFESPDLQRSSIDGLAHRLGVTVVDEIRDLNRSGGTLTRPGLQEALARVREGDVTGILVARSDRASRRVLHGLGLIDELDRAGGWIAAADGSLDTTDANRRMATVMFLAMSERQLESYREQSAVVHRNAIVDKGRHMGPAPFGYTRDEQRRLVPHPEEAPMVAWVFGRRADGMTFTAMSRALDEQGVRQRSGRKVNALMLRRMIARRVYVGEASHGTHVKPDAHPALVDELLFAQANRAEPAVRSSVAVPRRHEESLLRGLLRCAGCRYVLKRQPQRAGGFVWVCRSRLSERVATHDCAAPARIRKSQGAEVERQVIDAFYSLATGVAVVRAEQDDTAELEQRVATAEGMLDELSSLDVRRRLGAQRWEALTQEARSDLEEASRLLAARQARVNVASGQARETLEAAFQAATLAERQQALRSVIQAVMIAPDGTVAGVIPTWEAVELPRAGPDARAPGPWTG